MTGKQIVAEAIANFKHHITWAQQCDVDYIGDSTVARRDLEVMLAALETLSRERAVLANLLERAAGFIHWLRGDDDIDQVNLAEWFRDYQALVLIEGKEQDV